MPDWIKKLESDRPRSQAAAALFVRYWDDAYSIIPRLIEIAQKIDVDHGQIDLDSSSLVGNAIRTSAQLIRDRGYTESEELHRLVKDWIFDLNVCSELNVAASSVHALGDLWIPPDSVRERLVELVHLQRRTDNQHPNTIRGLAYRMLSRHDRETARELIDTPAKVDFQNAINHWLEEYRVKYPNNTKVPRSMKAEVEWLSDTTAG